MREPPDLTAFELTAACEALAAAGWEVAETLETRNPRAGAGHGELRVLRQRVLEPGRVQLVVSYPAFERVPRERRRDAAGGSA